MIIIGVMGGGSASKEVENAAYEFGRLIALEGWVLLNGGRRAGIMDASARGAQEAGGLTVGILPDGDKTHMSPYVDIPVLTDMGAARNNINVLSSDVVVACPGGAGTLSEIALAVKNRRPVVFMGWNPCSELKKIAPDARLSLAETPAQAIDQIRGHLKSDME